MRTIRAAEPAGFAFTFVTFTFPVLAAALALAPGLPALCLAAAGAASRVILHLLQRQWRLEPIPAWEILLLPLRDTLLLAEWGASWIGSSVHWRNHVLDALAVVDPPPPPAAAQPKAAPQAPLPHPDSYRP